MTEDNGKGAPSTGAGRALDQASTTATMRAAVRDRFGNPDVVALQDVDKPIVGDDQVLLRVRAASVNPYDWHMLTGLPYLVRFSEGLRTPKSPLLGVDVSGTIEAMGSDVTGFQTGDEVFGACGGAYAEYALAKASRVVHKPANVSFEQAAAVPMAAVTALQGLRDKGQIAKGQRVLVNGASGGIGTLAVQIAKSYGTTVTGVCSTRNLEMVRSIGADHVIDYTTDDYTRGGEQYDIILDAVGNRSLRNIRRALADEGRYVVVGSPKTGNWIGPIVFALKVIGAAKLWRKKMAPMLAKFTEDDLVVLQGLLESGDLQPVLDRTFPLSQTADALQHQADGHAQGKTVIVTVDETT